MASLMETCPAHSVAGRGATSARGYKPRRNYLKMLPAPKVLKEALLDKIDREIALSTDDEPGLIQLKTNALEDVDITRALYRASRDGAIESPLCDEHRPAR